MHLTQRFSYCSVRQSERRSIHENTHVYPNFKDLSKSVNDSPLQRDFVPFNSSSLLKGICNNVPGQR
jgi:hypothetical protein